MAENQNNSAIKTLLVCGLLTLSAVNAAWTLASQPLNNHECFVAVTAREMLQSGDWVMPTFNTQPRLQKTPLAYWLVAAAAKLTGRVDEFSARLPNAVFAVLSVAAILYFVKRWLSLRIALLSAAVWATSLSYIRYAHSARPEMAMTFFVILCFLSFYSAITEENRRAQIRYMLIFWISFAIANLAKGPAPIPILLVPLVFYVAIFRHWKKIPRLLPVLGTLIFLAIVLPWPLAIAHRVNWDLTLWKHEFVDRFFGSYAKGDYPLYYYLLIMFKYAMPWVVFLPMALAAPFYKCWQNKRPVMIFLWLWFVADFVFLTINAGKRQHYLLPLMPAIAILTGILIEDLAFVRKAHTLKQSKSVLRLHIALSAVAIIGLPLYVAFTNHQLLAPTIVTATIAAATIVAVSVLMLKTKPAPACAALFAGITLLFMISFVAFLNPLSRDQAFRKFSLAAAKMVPGSDELVAYKSASQRLVHYFGKPVPEIEDLSEIESMYEQNYWIVAHGRDMEQLRRTKNFEIAYLDENVERRKDRIIPAALFHKSSNDETERRAGIPDGAPNPQAP